MILHKYIDENGKDSIDKSELKVSIPSEFNDPFELMPRDNTVWTRSKMKQKLFSKDNVDKVYNTLKISGMIRNKKQLKSDLKNKEKYIKVYEEMINNGMIWNAIQGMKQYADQIIRIISFSSDKSDEFNQLLMWSHYTNKHKGLRLHFDTEKFEIDEINFKKVNYSNSRVPFDALIPVESKAFLDQITSFLITKSEAWHYEEEYRLILSSEYCYSHNKLFFFKIIPNSIVQIDLGFNSAPLFEKGIIELLKRDEYRHIRLTRASLDENEFKLKYDQINFV